MDPPSEDTEVTENLPVEEDVEEIFVEKVEEVVVEAVAEAVMEDVAEAVAEAVIETVEEIVVETVEEIVVENIEEIAEPVQFQTEASVEIVEEPEIIETETAQPENAIPETKQTEEIVEVKIESTSEQKLHDPSVDPKLLPPVLSAYDIFVQEYLSDGRTREEADSFWPYLSEESLAMYQELAADELAGKQ